MIRYTFLQLLCPVCFAFLLATHELLDIELTFQTCRAFEIAHTESNNQDGTQM